jgi:hypothetical protein
MFGKRGQRSIVFDCLEPKVHFYILV